MHLNHRFSWTKNSLIFFVSCTDWITFLLSFSLFFEMKNAILLVKLSANIPDSQKCLTSIDRCETSLSQTVQKVIKQTLGAVFCVFGKVNLNFSAITLRENLSSTTE